MSERENDFVSRCDDFERYVESKDAYFADRENELKTRRLNFEERMAKEEKNISDKEALVELKEKELQDVFSDSKFRLFSKFVSKNPKVSIIIPVYNVEDYIHQCLDSVANQTLKDIEIICMDDGSSDNSLKILQDYKKKDSRFKILTQKNKGPGAARNKCLDVASGEFVMFLDSDDWLDLDACKTLYEKAKLDNLDMVMFLLKNYSEETGEYYEDNYYNLVCLDDKFDNEIFSYKELGELVFSISVSPCQKIYKREILDGIKFHENTYFEDNPFYWETLFSSKRIALIRKHFYLRRRREASITISHDYKFLDCVLISDLVINVFKKYDMVDFFRKRLSEYKVAYLRQWYKVLNDDVKYDYWKLMRNDFIKIRNDENVHEKFIKCISEGSKKFYMDTLKSRSPEELEYLQKYN